MLLQLPGQNTSVKDLKETLEFFEEYEKRKRDADKKDKDKKHTPSFTLVEHIILTFFMSIPVGLVSAYVTAMFMLHR